MFHSRILSKALGIFCSAGSLRHACRFASFAAAFFLPFVSPASDLEGWSLALPGWEYQFPRDHGNHSEFKTEWWYFTGNLRTESGRPFGWQLTFFRQGIRPPTFRSQVQSRLVANDIAFAHFAVSDVKGRKFHFFQKITRGAFGESHFGEGDDPLIYCIGDWSTRRIGPHDFEISANADGIQLNLKLVSRKAPVFHGFDGVSQKADGPGRASHYYSLTRLLATGNLILFGEEHQVTGTAWFDHEWATNQLTNEQVGWDWFSLQFDDDTELMIFQIRTRDGGRDAYSGGTWIFADGSSQAVKNEEFVLRPLAWWKRPTTGAKYPISWRLGIPKLELELEIRSNLEDQELTFQPVVYWEGSIRATGSRAGRPANAHGYLEMTGYGSPILGMQAASDGKSVESSPRR